MAHSRSWRYIPDPFSVRRIPVEMGSDERADGESHDDGDDGPVQALITTDSADGHAGVRAAEELERAKARIAKEARREVEQNRRRILAEMLEVLDDLDRAIAAAATDSQDSALVHGVKLVRKNCLGKLAHFGVVPQPCLGEAFDPERHEAVSIVPVPESERDGVIVGVVRKGYAIGQDVLRPAQVAVGKFVYPAERD